VPKTAVDENTSLLKKATFTPKATNDEGSSKTRHA